MSISWAAKAAGETRDYSWKPGGDDAVRAASATVISGTATVAHQLNGGEVIFSIAGGDAGEVQTLALTAYVGDEVFIDTAYVPVIDTARQFAQTARDVCAFALRRVTGNGELPTADETSDALERLNDMLATWAVTGADIGAILPLVEGSAMTANDSYLSAIKNNLILQLVDAYPEYQPSPIVIENARRGLQLIKTDKLSGETASVVFF